MKDMLPSPYLSVSTMCSTHQLKWIKNNENTKKGGSEKLKDKEVPWQVQQSAPKWPCHAAYAYVATNGEVNEEAGGISSSK